MAFVAAGSLPLPSVTLHRVVRNQSALNSTDAILYQEYALEDGAAAIAKGLEHVPTSTPITIVYPDSGSGALAGMVVMELMWPRPVKEIQYHKAYGSDVDLEQVRQRGGVAIFLGTDAPSALGPVKSLRAKVHIIYMVARP